MARRPAAAWSAGVVAALCLATGACRAGSDGAVAVTTTEATTTTQPVVQDPTQPLTATGANANPRDDRIGPPANNRPADPLLDDGACFIEYLTQSGDSFDHHVQTVDCSSRHDAEVFAAVTMPDTPGTSVPGELDIGRTASGLCLSRFEPFVGQEYATSTLRISVLRPTAASWVAGDRRVLCSLYDEDLKPLVGTARNSAR